MTPSRDIRKGPHPGDPRRGSDLHDYTVRAVIAVAVFVAAGIIFLLLWYAFQVFLITFIAVLLSIFLRGIAGWISHFTRLPAQWALAATILLVAGAISVAFLFFIPYVSNQADELHRELLSSWNKIKKYISELPLGKGLVGHFSNVENLVGIGGGSVKEVKNIFSFTFMTITDIVVLLFVGLYFAFDPKLYLNGIVRLVPLGYRPRFRNLLDKIAYTLRWWLLGIFLDMAIVGVLTGIGLWLLQVPLALLLAIISGVLTFIPTFGLLISIIPAALLAVTGGVGKLVSVILLYLFAHAVEAYVIGPLVQQKMVALPPALMILALLTFGILFGITGLIVITPLLAAFLVVIKVLYLEDVLGDREG